MHGGGGQCLNGLLACGGHENNLLDVDRISQGRRDSIRLLRNAVLAGQMDSFVKLLSK